jgi:Domain of unknown function (DUF2760)
VSDPALSLGARIWFAYACFFRVLFDGEFAARAHGVREAPALPPPPEPAPRTKAQPESKSETIQAREPSSDAALVLLSLLQREGRFVDFVKQDIASHPDADIGAAARVVHEGCRKALAGHVGITPIRSESEGAPVKLESGFDPNEVKLTGKVSGSGPYEGVLRHPGWRAESITLPELVKGHDARVLAAAEVEL